MSDVISRHSEKSYCPLKDSPTKPVLESFVIWRIDVVHKQIDDIVTIG